MKKIKYGSTFFLKRRSLCNRNLRYLLNKIHGPLKIQVNDLHRMCIRFIARHRLSSFFRRYSDIRSLSSAFFVYGKAFAVVVGETISASKITSTRGGPRLQDVIVNFLVVAGWLLADDDVETTPLFAALGFVYARRLSRGRYTLVISRQMCLRSVPTIFHLDVRRVHDYD